jgi:hypothetical protein
MPLGKEDAPTFAKTTTPTETASKTFGPTEAKTKGAVKDVIDAGAGAPPNERQAAEDLPEGDPVKDAIKASLLAKDAQTEAKEKVKVVDDSSTGAEDTPSGYALKKTAGIADDVKRGEEYSRIKGAKRWGYVPATDKDTK